MDTALKLVEKNRGKVHENGTCRRWHLRSQIWGRGETKKAQRQEEQDHFAWHEGNRE